MAAMSACLLSVMDDEYDLDRRLGINFGFTGGNGDGLTDWGGGGGHRTCSPTLPTYV